MVSIIYGSTVSYGPDLFYELTNDIAYTPSADVSSIAS
jgi:hypothetical protein